jgi:immune inhibitor A
MNLDDIHCIMPPAPELEERILRTRRAVLADRVLPEQATPDLLDVRAWTLIAARPPRTRPDTFAAPTRAPAPVVGTRRALVLLVDFSDAQASESQAHYEQMLFSSGTYATGSMRDFYREASYGKLDVVGEVSGTGGPTAGWYRVSQPKTYYADGQYGFGTHPKNAQKLVEEAIDLAAPHVDFADYDNDGDGVVDALVVICAGSGAEVTGNVNDLWSHKWGITPRTVDGVTIETYFMAPEDGRVGVMAHELGHLLLRLPDLYDTDYSSAGTGRWDLMAGGSWNNGGDTPAHPTAWCKVRSGWVTPTTVWGASQSVTIKPYATNEQVYLLPVGAPGGAEYFLVSNRQQAGFDTHLPGEGCVVEHVDDSRSNNTDETHYLVDIEQADGQLDLNKNANRGDATDPYPAGANNAFTVSTTPSSKAYDGSDSTVSITNVTRTGDDITADLAAGVVAGPAWHYNLLVTATFAHHTSQWAWVSLDGLGWRRIKDGAPDAVTGMFSSCCLAVAKQRPVHAYVDADFVYTLYQL